MMMRRRQQKIFSIIECWCVVVVVGLATQEEVPSSLSYRQSGTIFCAQSVVAHSRKPTASAYAIFLSWQMQGTLACEKFSSHTASGPIYILACIVTEILI